MTEPTRELTQADALRLEFEKWVGHALPKQSLTLRSDARYADPTVEILWQSWQAAREAPPASGEGWVSVKERLPDQFERWYFDDEIARDQGSRRSISVPVVSHGTKTWGAFCQDSNDGGKSVLRSYWVLDDRMMDSDCQCWACVSGGVTHWYALPDPPKEGKHGL